MLLNLAQWVQTTTFSALLAGSTWAYPVIGALHVLGLAWFGGAVLWRALKRESSDGRATALRRLLWTGGAFMLLTGVLLFAIEPLRCAASVSFRLKLALLLALAILGRLRSRVVAPLLLTLWAAVLLASRGIAFF